MTDDIRLQDWNNDDFERYEYTENLDDYLDFVQQYSGKATEDEKRTAASFAAVFPASLADVRQWIEDHPKPYEEWTDGASYEEQYSVPMMYALRYFPSFVDFNEEDRYKVAGNTCLLYDSEEEAWAVGMTGGGMDLSPHLVATFINLEKGVPLELARNMRKDYNAYVSPEVHKENCRLMSMALVEFGLRLINEGLNLREKEADNLSRHAKGFAEALKKETE